MKDLTILLVKDRQELDEVLDIRKSVFVNEQKIPFDLEFDGLDGLSSTSHVIAIYQNSIVGTARIRFICGRAKLERIAILQGYRKMGFGHALMNFMVDYCKKQKAAEIFLHGQCRVEEFYRKCGFVAKGEPFGDPGIEHIEMIYRG